MTSWLAALGAACAASLLVPPRPRMVADAATPSVGVSRTRGAAAGRSALRRRLPWCLGAGLGAAFVVGGWAAPLVGAGASVAAWVALGHVEPPEVRRAREQVRRDLPHLVELFGAALRSGAAPAEAITVVAAALPGVAGDRLSSVGTRLALGMDPVQVWESLVADPELAPLGRALARSQTTGASVLTAMERLADELAGRSRADVEERARSVGVRAALPLGLCLLPAFILIGIVPLVAALLLTVVP